MYGKLFVQMYDGTLATRGPWQALVTFQQLVILADRDGIVDMTVEAIARRTTIPEEVIRLGIEHLEKPDPESRSPAEEGRRIVRLSDTRPWGWRLVNYQLYCKIRTEEDRREYKAAFARNSRAAKRAERELRTGVDKSRQAETGVDAVDPLDVDADVDVKETPSCPASPDGEPDAKSSETRTAVEVIAYLNAKTGRNFQPVEAILRLVRARLREGATPEQLRQVIDRKAAEWLGDPRLGQYLRPETLFNATKFASYFGQLDAPLPGYKAWHESASGIVTRGRELDLAQREGESFPVFKDRVLAADRARST